MKLLKAGGIGKTVQHLCLVCYAVRCVKEKNIAFRIERLAGSNAVENEAF
jgi:hypothetical protein